MAASKVFLKDKTTGAVASYTPDEARTAVESGGYAVASGGEAGAAEKASDEAYRVSQTSSAAAFGEAAAAGVVDSAIGLAKGGALVENAMLRAANAAADPLLTRITGIDPKAARRQTANETAALIMRLTGSEGLARDLSNATADGVSPTSHILGNLSGRQTVGDTAGILQGGYGDAAVDARDEYDTAARQRAIDAPGAALTGSIAGNVAGALLSGGGVSGIAGKGATLAARLGLATIDGAVGGIGAADEAAWLQGRQSAKAEDVIASMGLGAVFGGGLGGLGEVGGSLWRRASTGLGQDVATMAGARSLGEAAEQAAQPLTDRAAKTLVAGTKALMGLTDEQAAAYERGLTSRAFREVVSDPTGASQRAARELAPALETLDSVTEAATRTFREAKPAEVSSWLSRGGGSGEAAQIARARELGRAAASEIEAAVAELAGEKALQKFARDTPKLLRRRVEEAATATEAFLAIDQSKRELQKLVMGGREKLASGALSGSTNRDIVDGLFGQGGRLEAIQNGLRESLEDEATWGAAAVAQRERNAAITQVLGLKTDAEKLFKRTVNTDVVDALGRDAAAQSGEEFTDALVGRYATGRRKMGLVDEDTFARNLMRSGSTESRPADEVFDAYLRAAGALGDVVTKHGGDGVDADALRKAIATTTQTRDGYLSSQRAWNALQEAQEKGGGSYVQQLANSAPLLGAMVAGPAGAAVGGTLSVIARGATDPTGTIRAIAQVDKLTQLVDRRLGTGVREMLERRAPSARTAPRPRSDRSGAVRGATARAAAAGLVGYLRGDQTPSEAYSERAAQIEALTDDPERMALASAESLDGFAQRFPVLGGEVALKGSAALDFLRSKQPAPSTVETVFGGRQPVVTDREAAKWGRYWTATTDPLAVLDLARDGALEREHVEALQTLYPSLHAKLSATIVEQIQAGKVPYSARVQADALLGLDGAGEPAVSPQAQLARIAAAQRMAPKPRQTRTAPNLGPEQASSSANIWK